MATKAKPNRNRNTQPDDDDDDEGGGDLFSDDQRAELGNIINAAVSGQISRKLPNAIKNAVDTSLAPIRELLERNGGGKPAGGGEGDDDEIDDDQDQQRARGGKKGAAPAARGRKDPEVENMRKQLAKLTEEREQERTQTRNRERDTQLREQLTAAGVDPNRIRGAVAVLRDSMKYDDKQGEWSYTAKRDGFDEDLDVSTGVKEWASTDEGKSYLAPAGKPGAGGNGGQRANGGSGTRVQNGGTRAGVVNGGKPTVDPKAQKAERRAEAMQNMQNAMGELGGATIGIG